MAYSRDKAAVADEDVDGQGGRVWVKAASVRVRASVGPAGRGLRRG